MPLADSQRRTLVRGLFVALVVLPIVATVVWATVMRTGVYRAAWESELSAGFGLRITLDDVRHPRPGVVLLENLRGYDGETDAPVIECRAIEAEADGTVLRFEQPTIYADRAVRLFGELERRLRRETPAAAKSVSFAAGELTWRTAAEAQTLVGVEGMLGPADGAEQLLLNFRFPGTDLEHPVALRVSRQVEGETPTTSIELDTGAVVLPCSLLTPLSEAAGGLGSQARFTGRMKVRQTPAGWEGVVTGDVSDVDLDALVSRRFPHLLSGTAELRLHRAELVAGRVERGQMTIIAGPGQISRSLVVAGGAFLGMSVPSAPLPDDTMLLFDRLSCDVSIDGGDLAIRARTADRPGAVLWKDDVVYWREPNGDAQPSANLLRALVPFSELQVPAALQTFNLMKWLPLAAPAATTKPTGDATEAPAAPHVHLRGPVN